MSAETGHGPLAGTKITKATKTTNNHLVFVIFVCFVIFVSERSPWAVSGQAPPGGQPQTQPQTQAQQRPVFRGGTHFVRVDAYPTEDGKIVEGLKPDDFEVLEDGKAQTIESFDFVKFDTFTPEAERRDPVNQQAGFDLASDPRYRVFVIVVDLAFSKAAGAVVERTSLDQIQGPLVGFLDRVLGTQDLVGLLTSHNSVKDLVLAQKTTVTRAQIQEIWRAGLRRDDADEIEKCGCGSGPVSRSIDACRAMLDEAKGRYRADATFETLHDLVAQLGAIRQERKNVIFVSDRLPRARANRDLIAQYGQTFAGVCAAEFQRVANIDFDERYRDLLTQARNENVSFYVVTPAGLQAPVGLSAIRAAQAATDDLKSLASETGGIAIVNTNDLNDGMKRIADDLRAYYVLGYYTTNTKFDGGVRKITVRSKGKAIRARREYRAPTEAEIAAMAAPPRSAPAAGSPVAPAVTARETALGVLERASRPFVPYVAVAGTSLTVVAEISAVSIQAGRWKDGADVDVKAVGANDEPVASAKGRIDAGAYSVAIPLTVAGAWPARVTVALRAPGERPFDDWVKLDPASGALVGEPVAYRSASRIAPRPVAGFEFARNERLRAEWPVLAPLDRRELRLLDRTGKPIPVELPLSEDPAKKALVLDMSLSGLPRGDYLIELTAGSGATIEHRFLAIRIKQ